VNLAHEFAKTQGTSIEVARVLADGSCIDFAGDLIDHLGKGRLAYFELPYHPQWKYHAAVEVDGMIHDLWRDESEPVPLPEYERFIGGTAEYPAEDFQLSHQSDTHAW
jgi:hypothetical protein